MAPLIRNFLKMLAVGSMGIAILVVAGCGKKGLVKEISANATDDEKRGFALKLFREGAELLYKDNQAALTKFDEARQVDPTLIAAYFNAGVALDSLGNPQEAIQRYEACLAQNRQQPSCLDNLVLARATVGEVEAAEALTEQYLNEFPDAPFAMVAAAKLAFFKKDYSRAERYARQAIEIEAENVEALLVMARIFYERKQFPAAKWVLKNALEIAPSHGGLQLALGHTEVSLGLLHDALDSFAKAVEMQATDEALESYGLLLLKRGRVVEALPVLKRLADIRPQDFRNLLHLGNAYMANKMVDEAKTAYLMAQEKKPDDLDVNFNLGLLYFDQKPKDLAEIDRLKTAKGYFEAFLKKPNLSKDRLAEVQEYLKILNQKIEMEEYAAQSAKEAAEEQSAEGEDEDATKPVEEKPSNELKEDNLPPAMPEEDEGQEKDRPKKVKKQEDRGAKKKNRAIDQEEEDFLEDL